MLAPDRYATLVVPYYLQMMGFNPLQMPVTLRAAFLATSVTFEETQAMLASHWRPCVMGAWYALRFERREIGPFVAEALRQSRGPLTSPALIVVAILIEEADAAGPIADYLEHDLASGWGGVGFAAAGLDYLGQKSADVTPRDRACFDAQLKFGRSLRDGAAEPAAI